MDTKLLWKAHIDEMERKLTTTIAALSSFGSSAWGIPMREVPCVPLESSPGDVVVFNHNLMHSSFGGSARRRMFTMNFCRRCETDEEIADLESFINAQARFWIDHLHSDAMRTTGLPSRMRYLRQVMEHEYRLPELAAKSRAERTEPSRG